MKKYIVELDHVKFYLTILIVLYHIQYRGSEGVEKSAFLFVKNFGDCVVPAFAIVSGYLFWRDVRKPTDLLPKISRRITSLFVPYVLWNVVFTIYLKFTTTNFHFSVLDNIILWNSSPHFWYIFLLLFWTIFSPILFIFYNNKKFFYAFLFAEIAYLIIMGNDILHSRYIYILYTWAGYLGFKKRDVPIETLANTKKYRNAVCIFAGGIYLLLALVISIYNPDMYLRVWIYAFRACCLITFLLYFPISSNEKKYFRYSFWLFAVHFWMDGMAYSVIGSFISGCFYQVLSFVFVLFAGLLSGIVVNTKFHRVFNIMTGFR